MKDQRGTTTIIVICVMAVIMTLSMGLFLTASTMVKTSGRTLASEQCKIWAESFREELMQQMNGSEEASFGKYIRQNITDGSWPYYQETEGDIHDRDHAVREFSLQKDGIAGEIADMMISVYWLPEISAERVVNPKPYQVVVKITVEIKQQKYSITDVYECKNVVGAADGQWEMEHVQRK